MKLMIYILLGAALAGSALGRGARPDELGAGSAPIGEPTIAWYTTWETALAEAKRSNRPIFFMAAAAQCGSISGVFWPGYTKSEYSLFSTKEFIEASRKYVCVRLESYESENHQNMVRALLNGTFQNTAFTLFSPDGKEQLVGSGRGPEMVFGRSGAGSDLSSVLREMDSIAKRFKVKGNRKDAVLPDFHSLKQSLNVASADQKLLLYSVANDAQRSELTRKLQDIANSSKLQGVFHFDQAGVDDSGWSEVLEGDSLSSGVLIIRAGKFGQDGTVVAELPASASSDEIQQAALTANRAFIETTERKVYSEHVLEGRKEGVNFVNGMPHGEDRNGDGVIDGRIGERPFHGGNGTRRNRDGR